MLCQPTAIPYMLILQLKQTKIKLEVLKSGFQRNKNDMNTDKLALNRQSHIQARPQPMPAPTIRPNSFGIG